ncbi:MAG TPA: transcription-repair coupling factor [Kiritimatiellia bacterium]|nr:transcription-repair coupling factor [Kiritimatiellia bacterium]HMP33994.1 transcription-repair coupling factor [Kiritimatiellia bacterium]
MTSRKGSTLSAPSDVPYLANALRRGGVSSAHLPPWPVAAQAALDLARTANDLVVVVTDGPVTMDRAASDLATQASLLPAPPPIFPYPALEAFPGHGAAPHPHLVGDRLRALKACGDHGPRVLVTCIQAVMQKTVAPAWVTDQHRTLRVGDDEDPAALLPWLEGIGYAFETEVLSPGQAAWRGGILDVWPPAFAWPVRVEFFGNTIDSIRHFEPVEQRSRESLTSTELPPAAERATTTGPGHHLADHTAHPAVWVWLDREAIAAHAERYERSAEEAAAMDHTWSFDAARTAARARATLSLELALAPDAAEHPHTFDAQAVPGLPSGAGGAIPPDRVEEIRRRFIQEHLDLAADRWSVTFHFSTSGARDRFIEAYGANSAPPPGITVRDGVVSESFRNPDARRVVISDLDLFGRTRDPGSRYERAAKKARATDQAGQRIHAWTDIQPGDYVVHLEHGIGIYRGLFEIEINGRMQEALTIEYAEGAKIYVPVAQTHLLTRYIGVGKRRPNLHALGGKRWIKEKAAAERAVEDLASLLLETQAARDAKPGHAFGKDTAWQHEFENAFPYAETPDQAQAIHDVKADMESTRPMDRLICGDVGYGKTEVAMRAAFKAVMDGKQVAILVPTTVLAQQHFDTFSERMAAFPVRIAALSRFQSRAEQTDILERLARGEVDIVIGTHRLVQADVRFRDLGLVIIDEEQRFGVKHKEFLKRVRQLVDVLTMTATPIPRTLYMSLTGAKDLSIIETAPVERLPIETIVSEHRDDVVREAILRELNREGQVYFLHNRVTTIQAVRDKLVRLIPEARVRIAHGQMDEHELSTIMRAFTRGEFDVLLCTTIIESGLNIPNVNTIIIDRADRFGLSELYQLRGRVGRYKRKAYAYLLLPKHGQLFFMARQRIGAIKRYTSLGSGFKLAMRDLELRGAGNILGAEQSGHIATVGFDLYCQLLQRTVSRMKGEKVDPVVDVDLDLDFVVLSPDRADEPVAAVIPVSYIEDETLRVRIYRRFAALARRKQVRDLEAELKDRFGPLPESVVRLLLLADLKIAATLRKIDKIEVSGEKVIMTRKRDYVMADGKFPRLAPGPITDRLRALLALVEKTTG